MKSIKKLLKLVSPAKLQDRTVALKIRLRDRQPLHQRLWGLVRNADTSASPQTHWRRSAGDGASDRSSMCSLKGESHGYRMTFLFFQTAASPDVPSFSPSCTPFLQAWRIISAPEKEVVTLVRPVPSPGL